MKKPRKKTNRPRKRRDPVAERQSEALRLIDYLRSLKLTNREARDLLETGKVMYCGIPTAYGGREIDAARVVIQHSAPRIRPNHDLAIIHRDPHMLIVYKPPGMLSVPSPGRRDAKNVIGVVRHILGMAFPVHRLDEFTSGLMMVALTEECQRRIKNLLFHHRVERGYLALVSGRFPEEPCTVRTQMVRNRGDGLRGSSEDSDEDGAREAITHLKLREHLGGNVSLVEARLETGRTHQVRIHLNEKGYPVLGDNLYASTGISRAAPRLALHAFKLEIRHPFTNEMLAFEAPFADDLEALRRLLLRNVVR
ncbi:MAG: RluA family pseudouridine synthase [Deltaproteobacteria bacterium]|nr:RluA family pseudouridine synthase [Deltaproteobacteria bacterium]